MLVQKRSICKLERLLWYRKVLWEHSRLRNYNRELKELGRLLVQKGTLGKWEGCASIAEYYRSTGEAVMVHQIATGAIGKLCWYSGILQEHSGSCIGTEEYYRSTREAVLVQQSNIGAIGNLCLYSRILQEHSGSCIGTEEYYRSTREAVLVQQSNIEALWLPRWYSRVL